MLTIREYGRERGTGNPNDSLMFSQTNAFAFSDAPRQRLRIELAALGTRGLKLTRVTSSGHEIELTERQHITLLLPTHGDLDVAAGTHEFHASAGQSMIFRPNSRRTRVNRPPRHDYVALVLLVPVDTLKSEALEEDASDLIAAIGNGVSLGGASEIVTSLRSNLGFLFADLASEKPVLQSSRAMKAAEVLATEQFLTYLSALREGPDRIAGVSAKKVREAEEFMRANYTEPLSVSDIAGAVGVGTRSLQAAFRQARETTPRGSLVSIRLEKVQEAISRGGEGQSVTEIALACGFTHLGRFSRLYCETYGELPSETMRKIKRSGGRT